MLSLNPNQGRPGGDNGRDRNQGRPGEDNGRGVKAVSGGGSEGDGGDDVEWVCEALRAVGAVRGWTKRWAVSSAGSEGDGGDDVE